MTYSQARSAARSRLIERICPDCGVTHIGRAGREHSLCSTCTQHRGYRLRQREMQSEKEASGVLDEAVRQETLMPWEKANFRSIWDRRGR